MLLRRWRRRESIVPKWLRSYGCWSGWHGVLVWVCVFVCVSVYVSVCVSVRVSVCVYM